MTNHPKRSKQSADHYVYGKIATGQIDNRYRHDLWASCNQCLVYTVGKGACTPVFVVQPFYENRVCDEVFPTAADAYAYCNRRGFGPATQ